VNHNLLTPSDTSPESQTTYPTPMNKGINNDDAVMDQAPTFDSIPIPADNDFHSHNSQQNNHGFEFSLDPLAVEGLTSPVSSSFDLYNLPNSVSYGGSVPDFNFDSGFAEVLPGPEVNAASFNNPGGLYFDNYNQNQNNSNNNTNRFASTSTESWSSISISHSTGSSVAGPRHVQRGGFGNHQYSRSTNLNNSTGFAKFDLFDPNDDDETKSTSSALTTPALSPQPVFSPIIASSPVNNQHSMARSAPQQPDTGPPADFFAPKKIARTKSQTNASSLLQQNLAKKQQQQQSNEFGGEVKVKKEKDGPECSNCRTRTTPLWRRNPQGQPLCNACGLFQKLHGDVRPLSLKTDVIRKRNRSSNNSNNTADSSRSHSRDNSILSSNTLAPLTPLSGGSQAIPIKKETTPGRSGPNSAASSLTDGGTSAGKHVPIAPRRHVALAPAPPKSATPVKLQPQPLSEYKMQQLKRKQPSNKQINNRSSGPQKIQPPSRQQQGNSKQSAASAPQPSHPWFNI
jgi:hypothetical protein